MKHICILFAVSTLTSNAVAGEKEKGKHLFILSGQSNMVRMKPNRSFSPEIAKLLPGAKIEMVRVVRGGEPIRRWLKEWPEIAKKQGLDPDKISQKDKVRNDVYYQRIVTDAKKRLADGTFASVTFAWLQGESDNGPAAKIYKESLEMLLAKLRKDLNCPEMNVVICRISDSSKQKTWQSIRQAQMQIVKEGGKRYAWVDTDDLNGPRNKIHYTPEGYALLGLRIARQIKALIKGEQPAPNGRPE